MPCLRATSKQKDDRTTVWYCCTQYAPLLGVLGSLGLGLSGLWHFASRITDGIHSSVVIRRVTLLYYVISIMFRKFMYLDRKTLATINYQPGPCFFTLSSIYTSRAWPVLFTFISIDVPRLSSVVFGAWTRKLMCGDVISYVSLYLALLWFYGILSKKFLQIIFCRFLKLLCNIYYWLYFFYHMI